MAIITKSANLVDWKGQKSNENKILDILHHLMVETTLNKLFFLFLVVKCRPSCESQDLSIRMSYKDFPVKRIFLFDQKFCLIASHIWKQSCLDENRRFYLDRNQPELCNALEKFKVEFTNDSICTNWRLNIKSFLQRNLG